MTDDGINKWLQQTRKAGFSDEQIKNQLKGTGWNNEQIHDLLSQAPPFSTVADAGQPKIKTKKFTLIIVICAIAALLIGGGVFAYMQGYISLPFGGGGDAQQMLIDSFNKLAQSKSGEVGVTFEFTSEERSPDLKPIEFEKAVGEWSAQTKAKNATMMSDISQLRTALVLYSDDYMGTYPDSLTPVSPAYISKIPTQPDGTLYEYRVAPDKKSYTLSYTCLAGSVRKSTLDDQGTWTKCDIPEDTTDLSFLSALDEIYENIPVDTNINGMLTVFTGSAQKDFFQQNSIFSISGSYSSGGTSIEVNAELRIKDGIAYLQIRKFPSMLIGDDYSALQDKWIKLDLEKDLGLSEDISVTNFFSGSSIGIEDELEDEDLVNEYKQELAQIMQIAFDEKVIVAEQEGSEAVDGHQTHKISVRIQPENIPAFVQAYRADAEKRNVDLTNIEPIGDLTEIFNNLTDEEFINQAKILFQNMNFTFWIDKSDSTPRKMTYNLYLIPSDDVEKMRGKQFRLSLGITLNHLNEAPNVQIPENVIDYDEAVRLMSGMTEEEQHFDEQWNALLHIRHGLDKYYDEKGVYPNSLDVLLETSTDGYRYLAALSEIPIDVFSGKPYSYTSTGGDYQLLYTIDMSDPYLKKSNSFRERFVEGINTATKDFVSREVEADADTDGDGLTDSEEAEYGTSKYQADTDSDGFTDKEEIDAGFDPLKKPSTTNNTNTTSLRVIQTPYPSS